MKKTGLSLLQSVQSLYQQKIISIDDKNRLAEYIKNGIHNSNYNDVRNYLSNLKCLKEDKMNIIEKAIQTIKED